MHAFHAAQTDGSTVVVHVPPMRVTPMPQRARLQRRLCLAHLATSSSLSLRGKWSPGRLSDLSDSRPRSLREKINGVHGNIPVRGYADNLSHSWYMARIIIRGKPVDDFFIAMEPIGKLDP